MRRTKRLGRYHLTERIAYGGMAEIFRGFTYDDDGFRRDVAIKKLLPHYIEDRNFIDMLTDEFKLVSHLRHPNIAEVYELTEVDDNLLIAMEYVDGKDLRSAVEKSRQRGVSLQFDDIAYVLARALDGMHHAHVARDEKGDPLRIVHRDFSPSNILVGYDGTVKICDFGIAKATHNRVQTKTGIIKGKVKYMSPEQAFGRKLDWRSDIFSAGSVLYELATGAAPFNAANEIDLIFAVRDAEPKPSGQVNRHIPDELQHVIEKSMTRSRSGRYQTSMEFRDALLGFLRRYNPKYRRTKLARFLKKLWAEEIEKELRAMEDFVLDASPSEDLGRNLIADALGPDATYSKFSPNPTSSANADRAISGISGIESDKTVDDPVHEAKTEMIASPATKGRATQPVRKARGEKEDPIHNEKTALTDPNKYEDLPGDKTSVETPPKGHSVNE
jgi:serine/threonine-protein kinase